MCDWHLRVRGGGGHSCGQVQLQDSGALLCHAREEASRGRPVTDGSCEGRYVAAAMQQCSVLLVQQCGDRMAERWSSAAVGGVQQ